MMRSAATAIHRKVQASCRKAAISAASCSATIPITSATANCGRHYRSLVMPVFLNYVNHATINYGGGKVTVDSVQDAYDPIYMDNARPTLTYNTIQSSANAAMSANPNSFDDDGLPNIPPAAISCRSINRRIGPDIHDNTVGTNDPTKQQLNNSINGLFVRIRTDAGSPLDLVDLTTRWKATDIVYVVSGKPPDRGHARRLDLSRDFLQHWRRAPLNVDDRRWPLADRSGRHRQDRRSRSRRKSAASSSRKAQPRCRSSSRRSRTTATAPAARSTRTRTAANRPAAPGQWGGFYFGPASVASLDHVGILYGGGTVPIEGGFDSFNAVESNQADLRLANSVLQFNDGGGAAANRRSQRPRHQRRRHDLRPRAQPIIVNNIIRDNNPMPPAF